MTTYDVNYFGRILVESRKGCQQYEIPKKKEIDEILTSHADVFHRMDLLERRKKHLKKTKAPKDQIDAVHKEWKELKIRTKSFNLQDESRDALIPILEKEINLEAVSESFKRSLLRSSVINPARFAEYAVKHDPTSLIEFLDNDDLMAEMLLAGGAKKRFYGEALEIFDKLMEIVEARELPDCHHSLAMAVALEFAEPIQVWEQKQNIDPIQRFLHYVEAHLRGELDPAFPYFSVWEYRHIVDSDATDVELQWARDQFRRYRPDLVVLDDTRWRYCKLVKTDVAYQQPKWEGGPRTYRQIFSGGGKCGPRAWAGRFLCKAFGIPTWGVKQPGHAALSRWTDKGWETCLGGEFHASNWLGRNGEDFKFEAHARLYQPDEYFEKVILLECMAWATSENFPPKEFSENFKYLGPECFWMSLSRVQRRQWSQKAKSQRLCFRRLPKTGEDPEPCDITRYMGRNDKPNDDKNIQTLGDGGFVVPVCSCQVAEGVLCLLSFEGGAQINFLQEKDGSIELTLPKSTSPAKYNLSLRICNLHILQNFDYMEMEINGAPAVRIAMKYTKGDWQWTQEVEVNLNPADTLKLSRRNSKNILWGVAVKEVKFGLCRS